MKKYTLILIVFAFLSLGFLGVNINSAAALSLPLGCTSTSGYSPTTGVKCDTVVDESLPAGCVSTYGYSPLTGAKCDSNVNDSLPHGCTSTAGYSSTTGERCSGSVKIYPSGCASYSGYSVTTGQACGNSIPTPTDTPPTKPKPTKGYPGFFIDMNKMEYNIDDTAKITFRRADDSKVRYPIDVYITNENHSEIIEHSLFVGHETSLKVNWSDYSSVLEKGYNAILVCDSGIDCIGRNVNMNSTSFIITDEDREPTLTILSPKENGTFRSTEEKWLKWTNSYPIDATAEYYIEVKTVKVEGYSSGEITGSLNLTSRQANCDASDLCSYSLGKNSGNGGIYTVMVKNLQNGASDSNRFSISALETDEPSVTIFSPSGGETFEIGQRLNIQWMQSRAGNVNLRLLNTNNVGVPFLVNRVGYLGGNEYAWEVGDMGPNMTAEPGKYKLSISFADNDNENYTSNSYFKIINPASLEVEYNY